MTAQDEAERQVDGVPDTNAHGDVGVGIGVAVIEQLQSRGWVGKVEAVVRGPGESQCLAQTAGAGGELAGLGAVL